MVLTSNLLSGFQFFIASLSKTTFMKIVSIFLLSLCAIKVAAQGVVSGSASLESVVVYSSGVEMNHKAKINLPAGSSEVVINNVANSLDERSIQIGSTSNVTIMSVSFTKDYLKKDVKSSNYKRVEDSLSLVQKAIDKIAAEKEAEQSVVDLLKKNSAIGGANTGVNVVELVKMADYYKTKQLEVSKNLFALDEKEKEQQEIASKLRLQLAELNTDPNSTGGQLVVQLMAKQAASSDFNITYISSKASWEAFYDLRADNTSDPLKLSYKANVVQSTGIDWKKVKLTLSTGNPTINGTAPTVMPWLLRFTSPSYAAQYRNQSNIEKIPVTDITRAIEGAAPGVQVTSGYGQPGSGSAVRMRGMGSLSADNAPLYVVDGAPFLGDITSISPEDVESINMLKDASATSLYGSRGSNGVIVIRTKGKNASNYTTQTENELNATFDIDLPYDIVSNSKPHSVSLKEYAIPVQYKFFTAPKLDKDVFLVAEITDYEKLNLMPGNANIIFENMYVGKSYINPSSVLDTLSLSMGRDKKIVVTREKVLEQSGTKILATNRKQTVTYEIKIRNGKKDRVNLAMKEQYPISTDKNMEVELLESSSAEVNKETGILSWNLDIAPGETKKVRISYSVKYPKDKIISGL